jgi:propanol-preferring alcohol dehydrogenase
VERSARDVQATEILGSAAQPAVAEYVEFRAELEKPANRSRPMARTMKAAVVREFRKPLTIEEVEVPQPVISGIGGLGHMAVQYAKAMGLNVAAVDVDDAKLDLAKRLGAAVTVNAKTTDPVADIKKVIGGAHGALVTAVSPKAFEQAIGMVRRGGTVSLNGLPPGQFPLDIFGMVLNGITVRGSIVGTRLDLQESLEFAAQGKVHATVSTDKLDNINQVFERMHKGELEGRVVLDLAA